MRLIEHIFSIIAPSSCISCQQEGSLLCRWCVETALLEEFARCYRCNRLSTDSAVCPGCRRKTSLKHVWVRTDYTDIPRQLVHAMKFKYSTEAAGLIAAELLNTIPALSPQTIIVHVPTITTHVRSRGFDHAKRIATELSRLAGYNHLSALARIGQHRQVGSSRQQRLEGVRSSFRVRTGSLVKGADILLIDDVVTTGATLEEAARVLKAAGARSVNAAIFARAR